MHFMLLTPGTGHFYCGSCLRDTALAEGLRELGHQVTVVPLYLPLMLEEPSAEESATPVRMGGINVYLQQKSGLARRLPRFLSNALDRPGLLRFAARRGNMTDTQSLGDLTLSMVQGEHGRQRLEVEKLSAWIQSSPDRPDMLVLSNIMLAGVARTLREATGIPIAATLQGEAPFLDALPEPFRAACWSELSTRAAELPLLIAVSEDYRRTMAARLDLNPNRIHTIPNGISLVDFEADPPPLPSRQPRTVGYLARMCADKGLDVLVDAFLELKTHSECADVRLAVCGVQLAEDKGFVNELQQKIDAAGQREMAAFHPNVERGEKIRLLHSFSVLSVPATYGESFGLYLIEAMAAGVPVVQPRHAAFPEILAATEGGLLCAPDDPSALADGLRRMLSDPDAAAAYARQGRTATLSQFSARRMATDFLALCETKSGSAAH